MVVNLQPQDIRQHRHHTPPAEKRSGSRQYDSFVVRLWKDDESDSMLRVEVQHVQAGLSVEAVKVPLDWIVPEIMNCLQSTDSSDTGASFRPDEYN